MGVWLFVLVPTGGAQEVDGRWAPWVGCWRAVDDTGTAPFLCVVPLAGEAGVEMLDVVDGEVVSREPIFADGQQHAVSREDCEGWERSEFSDDSRRIFVRSELICDTSGMRSSTGVLSMVTPYEWLDVRTVSVEGQSLPWVVRYQLASRADFEAAGQGDLIASQGAEVQMRRVAASIPVTLDDVAEAAQNVSAETVQVWVVERGESFDLDASGLIRLAEAGVPPELIDVVVAVSYPDKFVVNDGAASGRGSEEARPDYRSVHVLGVNPFMDPFYSPYSRYGYYAPYGRRYSVGFYSGYGYGNGYGGYGYPRYGGGWGYNYGYGGYGTPVIVVGRRGSGDESGPRAGRVARGGGYTSAGGGSTNTGRAAQPRSSGSATQSSGSSGASSRSAPSRGSSSSSGRSTGRTAQPRTNPGN